MPRRIEQVNTLIRKEVGRIFLREFGEPGVLTTITRVETSSNLIEAKVFISVFPKEQSAKTLKILNKNIYEIQQQLNQRLRMRPIPRIIFVEEERTEEAGKIEEILSQLKREEK